MRFVVILFTTSGNRCTGLILKSNRLIFKASGWTTDSFTGIYRAFIINFGSKRRKTKRSRPLVPLSLPGHWLPRQWLEYCILLKLEIFGSSVPIKEKTHLTFVSPSNVFLNHGKTPSQRNLLKVPSWRKGSADEHQIVFASSNKISMANSSNKATLTSQIFLRQFRFSWVVNLFNCPYLIACQYVGSASQRGGPPHFLLLLLGLWPIHHSHLIQIYQRQHEKWIRWIRHEEKQGANKLRVLHSLSAFLFSFFHISIHFALLFCISDALHHTKAVSLPKLRCSYITCNWQLGMWFAIFQ